MILKYKLSLNFNIYLFLVIIPVFAMIGFGSAADSSPCRNRDCKIGVSWSDWSQWSFCSQTCGTGQRERKRVCPILNGCEGNPNNIEPCYFPPCNGAIFWSEWSPCTKTCDAGIQFRPRLSCVGSSTKCKTTSESRPCNLHACFGWQEWGQWSYCSQTCGTGQRERKRVCPISDGCVGNPNDFEQCHLKSCTGSDAWSLWSPCTKTCASGIQFKQQLSCEGSPPKCRTVTEQRSCNAQACPRWQNWRQWSECSRSCGRGQRDRKRVCPILNGCVGKATEVDGIPCNNFPC